MIFTVDIISRELIILFAHLPDFNYGDIIVLDVITCCVIEKSG